MTEEKYTIRKYKRILFYVVICVLLAAFLLGQYIYPSEREPVTEESITYTGTFYRVLADGTKEEIPVPGRCDVPAGMCSARHQARMRERKCGSNCSPLPTSIPVSSTRYIVGINQISGHICSTAILW